MMRVLVIVLFVATSAHANVWEDAIALGKPDPAQDKYDSEMRQGDEHAILADTSGTAKKTVLSQLARAVASYRAAALAKPKEGEPYYRLGRLLFALYFDCDPTTLVTKASPLCDRDSRSFDRKRAEEVVSAWNEFEARAPLDPRLSVNSGGDVIGVLGAEILFDRAILHTKLGGKAHLEAAAEDYAKILARKDRGSGGSDETVLANLAETYMMLGRLDDAIETYREALRSASDTSTWYGFAVALDRDERSQQALEVIKALGRDQRDQFHKNVIEGRSFFVPQGEVYYYFALADEAFGLDEQAIEYWRRFIASNAHPQFQPHAKAHLDALLMKKKRKAIPIEPPWQGIFR